MKKLAESTSFQGGGRQAAIARKYCWSMSTTIGRPVLCAGNR
jgi:hypothetical protein